LFNLIPLLFNFSTQFLDQEREVKIMRKVWEAAGERQKAAGTCEI
jgi:hypothetical protein